MNEVIDFSNIFLVHKSLDPNVQAARILDEYNKETGPICKRVLQLEEENRKLQTEWYAARDKKQISAQKIIERKMDINRDLLSMLYKMWSNRTPGA